MWNYFKNCLIIILVVLLIPIFLVKILNNSNNVNISRRVKNVLTMNGIKALSSYLVQNPQESYDIAQLQREFSEVGLTADDLKTIFRELINEGKIPEYFESVTEQDELTGILIRRDLVHKNGDWHRGSHVLVVDSEGKILLQVRGSQQAHPGLLDFSVTGHVRVGESYIDAALRETTEEIGLEISLQDLVLVEHEGFFSKSSSTDISEEIHRGSFFQYRDEILVNNEFLTLYICIVSDEQKAQIQAGEEVAGFSSVDFDEAVAIGMIHPEDFSDSARHYLGSPELVAAIRIVIDKNSP